MENKNLSVEFSKNLKQHRYVGIYSGLKSFFYQLNEMGAPSKDIEEILLLFDNNFDLILEKERQKMKEMRNILKNYYKNTFSTSDLPSIKNKKSENNENDIFQNDYNPNKNEFMKQKIADLIQQNITLLQSLLFERDFENKTVLRDLLLKIFDQFPDDAEKLFDSIFNEFINNTNFDLFIPLIDKIIDKAPKSAFFKVFQWISIENEKNEFFSNKNLPKIVEIVKLMRIYAQIYPDYFTSHLKLFFDVFIENMKNKNQFSEEIQSILNDFAYIMHFFSKHGEYIIAEYTTDLFHLALKVQGDCQRYFFISIKEVFENYPAEIAKIFIEKGIEDLFYTEILKLLKKYDENQRQTIDVLIDLFLLVKTESQKIKQRNLISSEVDKKSEGDIDYKEIINNYLDSVENLIPILKNHTYLFFKAVSEINKIFLSISKDMKIENLEKYMDKYIEDDEIGSEEKNNLKYKEFLKNFVKEAREYAQKLFK